MTAADVAGVATKLRDEARRANQRRLVVLAGDREAGVDAAFSIFGGTGSSPEEATIVSTRDGFRVERIPPTDADRLLGETRRTVVLDCHEGFSPNVLGRVVGAVDGGGLFVLLTPPLTDWPNRYGEFDQSLAVPPAAIEEVTHHFRHRLVATLQSHPGVAIVDLDAGTVVRDGLTGAGAVEAAPDPRPPADHAFPAATYDACLTGSQVRAVHALERLREPGQAVVIEADRGRGKSSAAGLAAGALAAAGREVVVTAPRFRNASEVFARARELLDTLDVLVPGDDARVVDSETGGVRYRSPAAIDQHGCKGEVLLIDEAAALPVGLLEMTLEVPAIGFVTTVRGYEGAGRGFSVRFRSRLAQSAHGVTDVTMEDPIRYARDDPVESWAFRALLLDARPAVTEAIKHATEDAVQYRPLPADDLLRDENLLRETFGLLVMAHYRTEPNDLARLLDAPNLFTRALVYDGHVVSVALLAREGGLDEAQRDRMYDGARVRGNMLPDVLTSQLRDPDAGAPVGYRVMRIATHHAVRSRGLGSRLLEATHEEFRDGPERSDSGGFGAADYFGVGYGATPQLVRFWHRNGYRTVHLATTRNESSGERSALMIRPETPAGRALTERHEGRFRDRIGDVLSDALREADPDVVRSVLQACEADSEPMLDLSAHDWRVVVGAAHGPGLYDPFPGPFRTLAVATLLKDEAELEPREQRLLVRKVLQGRDWAKVADELQYDSAGECMRAVGRAYRRVLEVHSSATAREERTRYE